MCPRVVWHTKAGIILLKQFLRVEGGGCGEMPVLFSGPGNFTLKVDSWVQVSIDHDTLKGFLKVEILWRPKKLLKTLELAFYFKIVQRLGF